MTRSTKYQRLEQKIMSLEAENMVLQDSLKFVVASRGPFTIGVESLMKMRELPPLKCAEDRQKQCITWELTEEDADPELLMNALKEKTHGLECDLDEDCTETDDDEA